MFVQLLAAQMNARDQAVAQPTFAEMRQRGLANGFPK
jgi:hypothetical protein